MLASFFADRLKALLGFYPQSFTGTTAVDSAAIDRKGFNTAFVIVNNAAATGGPSAATLTLTFSDGATSSPATAVTLNATPAVIDASAAACTMYTVDLSGFNRYFKATLTPAFTAGTAPADVAGMSILLSDAQINPATGTAVTPLAKA